MVNALRMNGSRGKHNGTRILRATEKEIPMGLDGEKKRPRTG